jgi:gamma-glutamylcyclotransferase (GGCT)/AIG2-like uncharacterized protein YtfP
VRTEKYFAYGSNISLKQMTHRCPSAKTYSKGVLKEYRIIFPIWSKRWGGGAAGIRPEQGRQVEGVVYELSEEDLKTLDKFEAVDKGLYYRKEIKVIVEDGSSLEAWVYITTSQDSSYPPSKRYLDTIIEGAREHDLSEEFMEYLKSLIEDAVGTGK